MRGPVLLVAGALCGILWWGVSWLLGAKAYGIWGTHVWTGLLAGIVTGIAIAALSAPIYRKLPVKSLYWFSPLTVYLSIALYGLIIFVVRILLDDFHPDQIPWAVGLQSIIGMWWGITMILPFAVAVQGLAYLNHRVLRKMVTAA
jgi:hypothetical protein